MWAMAPETLRCMIYGVSLRFWNLKLGTENVSGGFMMLDGDPSVASLQSIVENILVGNSMLGSDERNVVNMRFGGSWVNLQRISMM